jgi:hypothetical protein
MRIREQEGLQVRAVPDPLINGRWRRIALGVRR